MKNLLLLIVLSFFSLNLIAQERNIDIVELKNGSVIKGYIIEQVPNESLKIRMKDGSIFVFKMEEVSKISKDNTPIKSPFSSAQTYRDPATATVLSLLVPGLGQFYNGQSRKGIWHISWYVGSVVFLSISTVNMMGGNYIYGNPYYSSYNNMEIKEDWAAGVLISSVSVLTCWVVSMVDANRSARKINSSLGFASFRIGENSLLTINPDMRILNQNQFNSKLSYSYGLKLGLSF